MSRFWEGFFTSINVTPQLETRLLGASGMHHDFIVIGLDEKTKRLVLVSGDHDARVAALIQSDVQSRYRDYRVLVARPLPVSISRVAQQLLPLTENFSLDLDKLRHWYEGFSQRTDEEKREYFEQQSEKIFSLGLGGILYPPKLNIMSIPLTAIHVMSRFNTGDWEGLFKRIIATASESYLDVSSVLQGDELLSDRRHGVCPIPLYELTQTEWETVAEGTLIERAALFERMKVRDFFYPGLEVLLSGFVDHGLESETEIESGLKETVKQGHLIKDLPNPSADNVRLALEALSSLKRRGVNPEGELAFELTDIGHSIRFQTKLRPPESLFSKVLRRVRFEANAKLFELGGIFSGLG